MRTPLPEEDVVLEALPTQVHREVVVGDVDSNGTPAGATGIRLVLPLSALFAYSHKTSKELSGIIPL